MSGFIGRLISMALATGLVLALLATLPQKAYQGTLLTTCFYVLFGVTAQFAIGLGLALLCAQPIRARSFFRVVFFIPMMVTPVGVAYMFRMLADMQKGPLAPLSAAAGLGGVVLGGPRLVGAPHGADRRHLAVDAVHVHRAACRDREPAARPA